MSKRGSTKNQTPSQRNGRSISYRSISFLSCSDPKGVAEGEIIRKPKNDPKKSVHKSVSPPVELGGGLDLQESLILLEKLQEASNYMIMLEKKQKFKRERFEAIDYHTAYPNPRFSTNRKTLALQDIFDVNKGSRNPRFLAMNRETLSRQDMLLRTEDNADISSLRKPVSVLNVASTSSRQSSFASSSDHSMSLTTVKRAPNLIARLMGLDDMPVEGIIHRQSVVRSNSKRDFEQSVVRSNFRNDFDSEPSTIVLMRPMRSHPNEEERALAAKELGKKLKFRTDCSSKFEGSVENKRTSVKKGKDATDKKMSNSRGRNRKIEDLSEGISGKVRNPRSTLTKNKRQNLTEVQIWSRGLDVEQTCIDELISPAFELGGSNCRESDARSSENDVIVEEVWSLGWRNGLSGDETDEVVVEIGRLLLGDLLECLLTD